MTRARDVANVLSTATSLATDIETAAAISNHNSAIDPHTDYILESLFDAKADILTATAADTPARLAVGANDTVLMADSSTATGLKWGTVSAGGMTLLASGNFTASPTTISSISGLYKDLMIIVKNVTSTTAGTEVSIRLNGDNGSNYYATFMRNGSTSNNLAGGLRTDIPCGFNTLGTTNNNLTHMWIIYDYAGADFHPIQFQQGGADSSSIGVASWNSATAVTSVDIRVSAGTPTGEYFIYGVS